MLSQIVILNQVRVPTNIFKDLKGAAKQKKVEKHWSSNSARQGHKVEKTQKFIKSMF